MGGKAEAGIDEGHAGAQYNVGVMYDKDNGVPQDYSEAVKWYHMAAEQNHPQQPWICKQKCVAERFAVCTHITEYSRPQPHTLNAGLMQPRHP